MEKKTIESYYNHAVDQVNKWLDDLRYTNESKYEETILEIWNQHCEDQAAQEMQWYDLRNGKERSEVICIMVEDPDQKNTPISEFQEKRYASWNSGTKKMSLCTSVDLRNMICAFMSDIFESIMTFPTGYPIELYQFVMWPILKGEGLVTGYNL